MNYSNEPFNYPHPGRWTMLLVCALATASTTEAAASNYNFINIADSAEPSMNLGLLGLSLNNHGTVAFAGGKVGGESEVGDQGVFTGAGGPITTVIDNSGTFDNFRSPSINDNGIVAFYGEYDGPEEGIFTSNGGPVTTIAQTGVGPLAGQFPREVGFPVINSSGDVAFRVFFHELDPSRLNFAIYKGSGGPLTLIADSSGPLLLTNSTPLHMNDSGIVAFAAVLDARGVAIVSGNGGPLSTLLTDAAGFTGFSDPSINANGALAFSTGRTNGVRGIFTSIGGAVTTVADSDGPFNADFGREALINASGKVAFRATLDAGGSGIFTGPDPIADKVIQTGDSLFGSTVTVVGHLSTKVDGTFDINDNGDVAFRYELANGTFGIAVAWLVPEPASLIHLAVSLVALLCLDRRQRHWLRSSTP
jgi:hypothetical protein